MRFHSTSESVARGEISALAILECLISITIYGAIGYYWNTMIHIAVAIACAPLLLLRTRYSYAVAFRWWENYFHWESKSGDIATAFYLFLFIVGIGIRTTATAVGVVRYPRQAITSIPRNWRRQTLCTDLFFVPEIVPGESRSQVTISVREVMEAIHWGWKNEPRFIGGAGLIFGAIMIGIVAYVPAILFRISFKATSAAYFPLIFVARSTLTSRNSVSWRLERITKGELEKARRRFAAFVLAAFAGKAALVGDVVERGYLEKILGSPRLTALVADNISWWQVAIALDSIMTFAMFFYADWALARSSHGDAPPRLNPLNVINTLSFLRGALATSAILYFFFPAVVIVARHAAL